MCGIFSVNNMTQETTLPKKSVCDVFYNTEARSVVLKKERTTAIKNAKKYAKSCYSRYRLKITTSLDK